MRTKFFLPVLLVIFLASCTDEGTEPAVENPSEQINAIAGELSDDVVTMVQAEGVDGAIALIDLLNDSEELGRISPYQPDENRAFVSNQIGRISHLFTTGVANRLNDDSDDFEDIKGVYVWNFDLGDFEKVDESDILVIAFPVGESTTNNGEFRLTAFESVVIDEEELPTNIKADMSIDDVEVINLDFVVNYAANGNPEVADIYLVVPPFALDVQFDDTDASATSLSVQLLLNSENLVGVSVNVEFDSEEKLEPIALSGEVSYLNLKIVGSISDDSMDESEDGDPNDYIDLELHLDDQKIGDIVFVLEEIVEDGFVEEEYVPYLQYEDGTQEKLEDILAPVIEEIEDVLEDFE